MSYWDLLWLCYGVGFVIYVALSSLLEFAKPDITRKRAIIAVLVTATLWPYFLVAEVVLNVIDFVKFIGRSAKSRG